MIRINLLGQPKPKNKRVAVSAAAVLEVSEAGSPNLKLAVIAVLVVCFNGWTWYHLDKSAKSIAKNMASAEQQNRALADVKTKYLERQREADNYKRRVDVIDQLRANQSGPVELLNSIGETVNNTEAVWLSTMKDQGNSVDIEGMALSADAVANLIQNLEKSGHFKNIEIKETFQDDGYRDMQAFQFTLTCEKAKS